MSWCDVHDCPYDLCEWVHREAPAPYRAELDAKLRAARLDLAEMAEVGKRYCDAQGRDYPPQLQALIRWLERKLIR